MQLQNQYDNWRQSRWNHPATPRKTIECRECHMPLVDSHDPAAGDATDYNRTPNDGKHRSHRFVAANQMMPAILKLPGWEKQVELTEQWLQGKLRDSRDRATSGRTGPAVDLRHRGARTKLRPGEAVRLKLVSPPTKSATISPPGRWTSSRPGSSWR